MAPEGMRVENPVVDVTPARYVTAIITERGVAYPPFEESLKRLAGVLGRPFPEVGDMLQTWLRFKP